MHEISCIIKTVQTNTTSTTKEINIMSKNELIAKIEALSEWENIIAEAQAEAESRRG